MIFFSSPPNLPPMPYFLPCESCQYEWLGVLSELQGVQRNSQLPSAMCTSFVAMPYEVVGSIVPLALFYWVTITLFC